MESLSNVTKSAVSFMLSVYVSLWTALGFVTINTYEAVRYISQVYPPAGKLLVAIEKTVTAVWAPSSDATLSARLHKVIEEVWTPGSVLEALVSAFDYAYDTHAERPKFGFECLLLDCIAGLALCGNTSIGGNAWKHRYV